MTGSDRNLADIFEGVADSIPDAPAQQQGDRSLTWREVDERADGVARRLLDAGLVEQDKVAQYLYNGPEYLESVFAAFKAGMAVVNTNYRYSPDELVYLWDNADVTAVVFHGIFADTIESLRTRVPRIRLWLWVDDGSGSCPDWAESYTDAAAARPGRTAGPWGRSGDHLLLLYTGGTTGMPKGVMWRQGDLFGALDSANRLRMPPGQNLAAVGAGVTEPGPRVMPAAPLMHGTGLFNAISTMMLGGSVTTLDGRRFDPVELLDAIERHRITTVSMVGDAFGKPILRELDAAPHRWDISSLSVMFSSGVIWSKETKAGLLRHHPGLRLVDALGSSEAIGMATSTTTSDAAADTAMFRPGPETRIVTDDGRDVIPGSGEIGRVMRGGYIPLGYYRDAEKTAATFQTIDGERYSIPGDWAEVLADGGVRLLGRGSQCINTGGEKVYPEEVEECLKLHPAVADAAVVGVPDDRFGEAITAVVELAGDADDDELIAHVKDRLARYKAPRRVVRVDTVGRAVNGKLDYRHLQAIAATSVG